MRRQVSNGMLAVVLAAVLVAPAASFAQVPVGTVMYDFDTNIGRCDPDEFTFFGHAQVSFGHTTDVEDGDGAFQSVDWAECDLTMPDPATQCAWAGAAIGLDEIFINCPDDPDDAGVHDAGLDLSLGTGISIRVRVDLGEPAEGSLGTRLALILMDDDGTVAATPGNIDAAGQFLDINAAVNRRIPLTGDWTTLTFLFRQLTWAWDDDHSEIGTVPGLDLANIKAMKLLWYRESSAGAMRYLFDEITLVDTPPGLYFDRDTDDDVDLADFAPMQRCMPIGPDEPGCEDLDADYDGDIDVLDLHVLTSCLQGPDETGEAFPWCY